MRNLTRLCFLRGVRHFKEKSPLTKIRHHPDIDNQQIPTTNKPERQEGKEVRSLWMRPTSPPIQIIVNKKSEKDDIPKTAFLLLKLQYRMDVLKCVGDFSGRLWSRARSEEAG